MRLPSGLCLGVPHQNAENDPGYYDVVENTLEPPGTLNWKYNQHGENFFPMLWRAGWAEDQRTDILNAGHGDKIWFIGNEPHSSQQGDETPGEFAEGVQFWEQNIGLPFAIPGINWSMGGYLWWMEYLMLDTPKPDAYHVHVYPDDADEVARYLNSILHLFSDRPLIITEVSAPGQSAVTQYEVMRTLKTYTDLGMVEAMFWFASGYGDYYPVYKTTDCLDTDWNITKVGESYKYWAHKKSNDIYFPVVMG